MSRRGDVILVRIPYYDRPGAKERPAIVVECHRTIHAILRLPKLPSMGVVLLRKTC